MFFTKATIFFAFTSSIFALKCTKNPEEDTAINCLITRKCSLIEDIVWATDGVQCFLFRNPCIFGTEMCLRRDQKLEEFKVITREECKQRCHDLCTEQYAPVCGAYDNETKNFPNKCDFYRQSCQHNKSYIFLNEGECNQAVPA